MLSVIRKHDTRDRDACESAYRRGQEAWRRSAGAVIVNPFLPGTSFHKAFDLGIAQARACEQELLTRAAPELPRQSIG